MKTTTLLCFVVIVSVALPALADTQITAPSRISAVTVFADRAQVTRSASVNLNAGGNVVTFEDLPQLMAEESLRVDGKGTGRTRITGISVKKVFLERIQQKRVHELEDQITALNRKVEGIEARRKGFVAQRNFIDSIRVGWGERISKELALGKPTTAELGDAARFVGEGTAKIEDELYDLEAAKKPLLDKIAALKKELEQNKADRKKEVRQVQVALEAERAAPFSMELTYVVGQAHWEPTYDVRLLPDGKEAELVYRAQVWQKSGEDWPGVKLMLSTASPEVGGAPPELFPWRVWLYEPPRPVPYQDHALRAMAPAAAPMAKGAPQEAEERAVPVTARVTEGLTSVLFNISRPADVPSDGTRAGSTIAIEKVPVTAEYVTTPKLSQRVYLKSAVTNDTPYPLLPGEVNVFNDTTFTGKTYLKQVATGEKFDLYFGADDQIKVKRDVARVGKKGGILSSNSIRYRVTNEIHNFKKRAVTVSLLDQTPLPGNAEIKVSLEDAEPKPDEAKPDGTQVWKVNLAPGEKKKVSYDIVVEYPKGRELTGAE